MKKKLQIFVSSTFTDLQKERQAAVEAILKAGHIPAGMELFSAGNQSQWDTITKWIDESDAYMLILGGRYGSIEESSGLSYTELEFDYATKVKKPLFSVVMSDKCKEKKVKEQGLSVIEAENSKNLNNFRTKVLKNISQFFDDEKDIKLTVHESISEIASQPGVSGWISASEVNVEYLEKEIIKLNREKENLQKKLDKISEINKKSGSDSPDFDSIFSIFKARNIKFPSKITSDGKTHEMMLVDALQKYRKQLVSGVTNAAFTAEVGKFIYFNVCPELQIYNLSINEQVPGVQYRRSALNERGLQFLRYLDQVSGG